MIRFLCAALIALVALTPVALTPLGTGSAAAADPTPYSGTQVIDTGKPFDAFVEALRQAVSAHRMGIVAEACAHCGAESIGVTIPGNRVIMIFKPQFAVRMLDASVPAGIEAPLRLYVTEQSDGSARLTYRLPSHVFGAYDVAALDEMAAELDLILAGIVGDALK